MQGTVGTLSSSDSDSVGHDGPDETLSPSDSDYVGHDGPDGTLSYHPTLPGNTVSGRSCWDTIPSRPC